MRYATVKKWLPEPLDAASEQVTMRMRELPVAQTNMRSRATPAMHASLLTVSCQLSTVGLRASLMSGQRLLGWPAPHLSQGGPCGSSWRAASAQSCSKKAMVASTVQAPEPQAADGA
jgi:hypothetical protein